jgi:hypothetical protein
MITHSTILHTFCHLSDVGCCFEWIFGVECTDLQATRWELRILRVADKYQFLPRKFRRLFGEVPRASRFSSIVPIASLATSNRLHKNDVSGL